MNTSSSMTTPLAPERAALLRDVAKAFAASRIADFGAIDLETVNPSILFGSGGRLNGISIQNVVEGPGNLTVDNVFASGILSMRGYDSVPPGKIYAVCHIEAPLASRLELHILEREADGSIKYAEGKCLMMG